MTRDHKRSKISKLLPSWKKSSGTTNFNFNYGFVFSGEVRGVYDDSKETKNESKVESLHYPKFKGN